MTGRNKGFDPLSSLFEAPEPSIAGEEPETEAAEPVEPDALGRRLEFTDPTFKTTPSAPSPAVEAPASPEPPTSELSVADKQALATRLAAEATARAAAAGPTDQEKRALAARLAAEAAARAAAAGPSEAEKRALAAKLAAEAAARLAQAGPTDEEKRALAAKLAAQAAAKPAAPVSRLDSLASRAKRPRNALEAARAAAAAEATRKKARPAKPPRAARAAAPKAAVPAAKPSGSSVETVVRAAFPGAELDLLSVKSVGQLAVLRSLWSAHRARFLAEASLVELGGASAVYGALERGAPLGGAHVRVGGKEAAVFVDLSQDSVLAVFPEPGTYLAGMG